MFLVPLWDTKNICSSIKLFVDTREYFTYQVMLTVNPDVSSEKSDDGICHAAWDHAVIVIYR